MFIHTNGALGVSSDLLTKRFFLVCKIQKKRIMKGIKGDTTQ